MDPQSPVFSSGSTTSRKRERSNISASSSSLRHAVPTEQKAEDGENVKTKMTETKVMQ